jgi:hypothetical protein
MRYYMWIFSLSIIFIPSLVFSECCSYLDSLGREICFDGPFLVPNLDPKNPGSHQVNAREFCEFSTAGKFCGLDEIETTYRIGTQCDALGIQCLDNKGNPAPKTDAQGEDCGPAIEDLTFDFHGEGLICASNENDAKNKAEQDEYIINSYCRMGSCPNRCSGSSIGSGGCICERNGEGTITKGKVNIDSVTEGNYTSSCGNLKEFKYKYFISKSSQISCGCTCQPRRRTRLFFSLKNCNKSKTNSVGTDESSGLLQVENLMDGSCQSLFIPQPTLSVDDSQAISLPSSNSLKSISLAPPYSSSNIQFSEAGAIINLSPLFGRNKTMNINFELNSPAEPNTVIEVTCPCPLDVKLSSFKATLEAAKEQVALTWEILEGDNAYLNVWGAQLENDELKNVKQFNTKPILIDETVPLMSFSLPINQLNPGATYFALESVSYDGECVTYCDDIDAVVLGPVTVDLESVKNLCNREMKRQIALFGNTGSCIK